MRVVSTYLSHRRRLQPALLERLAQAGAEGIELFCARQSFDYTDLAQVEELAAWLRHSPLRLHSVHAPLYAEAGGGASGAPPLDITEPDRRRRLTAVAEIERVLELADKMPYGFLVQHLGVSGCERDDRRAEAAFSSLERLRMLAKPAGVILLVENIPNALATPDPLMEFLDRTHLHDIGVCFDSGHAHLPAALCGGGGVLAAFERLRPRLRSTHLHDNRGQSDDHLWPGEGTIAWPEIMPRLAGIPDLPWVVEIGDDAPEETVCARLADCWRRLAGWAAA